jgi:hypothetical protein
MKREDAAKYLGKKVIVTLFNNDIIIGILEKGNGYFETNNDYHIMNELDRQGYCFKISYVKKLEEE